MLKLESSNSYRYDVFLSFRGEDTRKNFTDHLYTALSDQGLITFRDDEEIERGESIKSELEQGIQQSRSWIIVFSKNFAFSSWCLDELVLILECRNNSKRLLLPIFYHVDPSDIRKQSGCVYEALCRHEEKFKTEVDSIKRKDLLDKVKRWRIALTQVANLGGMPLQDVANGYESIFIQKIINVVRDKVNYKIPSITPRLVGIDASVESVRAISLWLRYGYADVEVFALYGMGGVGKTTIAKYVYNTNFQFFEGSSFLENIREYSERSDGLVCLQRQLLSDISKGKTPTINNLSDGIHKIQTALHQRKLLIVLDDVDRVEQLNAVFGMREWFYQGSKIIITTRNVHLLNAHEHCKRYAVEKMNFTDSLELFSWHAFRENRPPEGYINHVERIIKQCQGLPLALEVVGASLRGKKVDVWRSAIEKLEMIPHCKIQKMLQISYESLQDDHDRDLFLEIACFFNGEAMSFVVGLLDECNYFTTIGIENLIDRCLLKIDDGKLRMHQSIQSMGREIIRQPSPKDPGQRSRVWHYKDSLEVLKDETGTRTIEGLALDMDMTKAYQTEFRTEAFSVMHRLRILKLNKVRLRGGYKDFPKKLKWLSWHGYTLRSLPNDFPFSSLVALDMQSSKLQTLGKLLGSLKFLNLSNCHDIVKTPDFAQLPALEQLLLEDCVSLVEIDESIGMAEGLVLLNLKNCKLLKKLPNNLCMLKLLQTLIISGCSNLGVLPIEMRKMVSLKVFYADGLSFGNSGEKTQENESMLRFIWGWVSKPRIGPQLSLTSLLQSSISELSLANCNLHDNAFPKDFCVTSTLRFLNLSRNPIHFLPDCFKNLKKVEFLWLTECNQLEVLEDLPNIDDLVVMDCPSLEKITWMPGASFRGYCPPWGCTKLIDMGSIFKLVPIGQIDSEFINSCGIYDVEVKKKMRTRLYNSNSLTESRCPIQGVYEQLGGKTFSIFYPGDSVPDWFTIQCNASSVSFITSRSKLRYINTCIVYKLKSATEFFLMIDNRTKDDMIIYRPTCYGIPEGDEYMTWLSHWKFGMYEVAPGDEVTISTLACHSNHNFEVKEIGVELVYEEEERAYVHSTKLQETGQTSDNTSQYVIPYEIQPWTHHRTTHLYILGHVTVGRDFMIKRIFS
ncbi:disease resistance protein RUN1-like isoform X2 [Apium graveolens]|uniref:disease resistance protein RUN1-like isoform X2 n=1 Tax=Apium graveolens TaxID=4045 RepID=UPI003D78E4D2